MLRIVSFCLLIILQVVTAEPPPPHCRGPPPGVTNPEKCCSSPHVFKDEDLEECGIARHTDDEDTFRKGPPDCSKQKCLLNKYKLMKDDNDLDKDAVVEFLGKWADANPDYKNAAEKAKEYCLKKELPGPIHPCGPTKIMYCIKTVMFVECPKWEDSDNCKKLKDHVEECKSYFTQL